MKVNENSLIKDRVTPVTSKTDLTQSYMYIKKTVTSKGILLRYVNGDKASYNSGVVNVEPEGLYLI